MTLQTAKNKILKTIKTQQIAERFKLPNYYNNKLITYNKVKAELSYEDSEKLTKWFNKL